LAEVDVVIVGADQFVWSGAASKVNARTSDGEIGVLPGHSPVLAVLAAGELSIEPVEGSTVSIKDTIEGFKAICDGDLDHIAEQAFFNVGGLDDVERQWAKIQEQTK
jgi:F0F1-type ATP synthase epsilon subunit